MEAFPRRTENQTISINITSTQEAFLRATIPKYHDIGKTESTGGRESSNVRVCIYIYMYTSRGHEEKEEEKAVEVIYAG